MIGIIILLGGLTLFFYVNLSFLLAQYLKMKEQYFPDPGGTPLETLKYFCMTEGNLNVLNGMCAALLAALFLPLNIGFFGPIMGAVFGWFVPKYVILFYRKKRLKAMQDQFAPALVLLANAMKAGETLEQAFDSTRQVIRQPMALEFTILIRQFRIGMQLPEAMEDLHRRVPLEDVRIATKSMLISIRTGANLPEALDRIATTIRSRYAVQGKIDALTAQGKAQGLVVGLLPIFLLIMLHFLDPEFVKPLFTTWIGNLAIVLMVILEALGFFVIKKICIVR